MKVTLVLKTTDSKVHCYKLNATLKHTVQYHLGFGNNLFLSPMQQMQLLNIVYHCLSIKQLTETLKMIIRMTGMVATIIL